MEQRRILLVDDDADMLQLTGRWLAKGGYEVTSALSGGEALERLREGMPDLILLDYRMPGMDGPETLAAIRALPGGMEVPVFFLTGIEEGEEDGAAQALHPLGFLSKALGKKGLLAALEDLP